MSNEIIILKVEGMACSHCENSVKKSVGTIDGVSHVEVDLAGKTVTVEYDPNKIQLEIIKAAVNDIGFEVI